MKQANNVLNTTARSAIVSSFVKSFEANENTGSHIHTVCETAQRYLKGADVSKSDADSIVKDIAHVRGWKDESLRSRGSEVRVVLRAYANLPEAIEGYKAKAKYCTWHAAMKLARQLNKHDGNVRAAVTQALKVQESSAVSPQGRAAGALKSWYKIAKGDKRARILEAAQLLGLKLGVKLDA